MIRRRFVSAPDFRRAICAIGGISLADSAPVYNLVLRFIGKPKRRGKRDVVKIWQKLQNPFALVAQGFAVGGLLFWTTRADAAASLLAALQLA
jgi:hypothetical protein